MKSLQELTDQGARSFSAMRTRWTAPRPLRWALPRSQLSLVLHNTSHLLVPKPYNFHI